MNTRIFSFQGAKIFGKSGHWDISIRRTVGVVAPVEWWTEVARTAVEDVLVWGGGGEVLIDGITKFAENVIAGFQASSPTIRAISPEGQTTPEKLNRAARERAKLVVSPNEAHEEMIINYLFYIKKEDDGGRQIKKWLVETLKELPPSAKEPSAAEVREEVVEKKEGIADDQKSIQDAEEKQDFREMVEDEKRKAAAAVAPIA